MDAAAADWSWGFVFEASDREACSRVWSGQGDRRILGVTDLGTPTKVWVLWVSTAEKKVSRDYSDTGVEHETVLEEKQPTERKIRPVRGTTVIGAVQNGFTIYLNPSRPLFYQSIIHILIIMPH